ncbi:MAG: hypothetical protein LBD90_08750, partial [Bifidobacteriaceae bacterium]|nr:hypothetical protein [Bifidobacteriaceae bacterium]
MTLRGTTRIHGLGLDIGTTNTKAALVALDGPDAAPTVIGLATAPTPRPQDMASAIEQLLAAVCPPAP